MPSENVVRIILVTLSVTDKDYNSVYIISYIYNKILNICRKFYKNK